jgi:uncharacterized alkaline shock family protein YloU
VGKSGTGKSYQAISLCNDKDIEYIVDDGLFIGNGTILAGRSAKRQATKVAAIKTALFTDDAHRNEVAAKIAAVSPSSLLVVGTSDRMVDQITERLGLPKPDERIGIEQITTADEREIARKHRKDLGQHIIPAPTLEVKREFSGYFLHPIKVLRDMRAGRANVTERSVVRPTFSYLGNYLISDKAIIDMVSGSAGRVRSIDAVSSVFVRKHPDGVSIDIGIIIIAGNPILDAARVFQQSVKENIEQMTSMNILSVDVEVEDLMWEVAPELPEGARI